jgi:hypothetical protein
MCQNPFVARAANYLRLKAEWAFVGAFQEHMVFTR